MEGNPEYEVWFLPNVSHNSVITIYRKGASTLHESCVYRVRAEEDALRRNFRELIAVLQLAGDTNKVGDVHATLDRESILAVVPQWSKVL